MEICIHETKVKWLFGWFQFQIKGGRLVHRRDILYVLGKRPVPSEIAQNEQRPFFGFLV